MFIGAIVLGVIAVLVFLAAFAFPKSAQNYNRTEYHPRKYVRLAASGVLTIAVLLLLLASFVVVGTRQFGVGVAFGRPTAHYSNGFHAKAPWVTVHDVDGTQQNDKYAADTFQGAPQRGADGSCINVRIALNGTACANVIFRWQNKESGVDYLFRNYKGHDAIKDKLVLPDLQTAVNQVLSTYNPLDIDSKGNSTQPTLADISNQVKTIMQQDIGQWINVQSVLIPIIHFDPGTQGNLNAVQAQVGLTRKADQAKNTAAAQAAANKAISDSISKDPSVLAYQCLTGSFESLDKGHPLPAGWNCFGASNFTTTNK